MNPILSSLPLSLQLLTLLALLALYLLDCVLLLPRLQAIVVKIFASLDNSGWDSQVAADHPILVRRIVAGLIMGSFSVRQIAVVSCLWFGWREAALLWLVFPWLFTLALFLVSRLQEWRFPARSDIPVIPADLSNCGFYSATDPDFEQRVVTAGNCADFGLTPEQVAEIAASDTPFKPAAPAKYTFFSVEGVEGGARMVIAERNRPDQPAQPPTNPPADADLQPRRAPLGDGPVIVTDENCADFGLTPELVRQMTARLLDQTRRGSRPDASDEPGK